MTDLDRGKDYEPDIYATHEEEYDDFDVDEEEEGGSRAAIILLIVIGVVLLLGVAYVSYRMGYENGQREASVPRLQANSQGGKVQPEEPGGLEQPQESALDDNVTGEDGDDFAQLLPREEQVIEVPVDGEGGDTGGAEGEPVPGVDVPITIGVDPDSAAEEPADAPGSDSGDSAPEPSAPEPAEPEPEPAQPEPETASPSAGSTSSRIMVPKPGGASPGPGSGSSGPSTSVPSPSSGNTVPSPSAGSVPAPSPSAPSGPAPTPGMSGNYVIQLASLPSQEAAESAWRNTSSKYSDLLEGAVRDIEEADLGERGIFYRLRIGYFDSLSDAKRLCETLKSRGQDCLVKSR